MDRHSHIEANFRQHSPADLALCSVVKAELLFGARHSKKVEQNLQCLKAFFQPSNSLPFDDKCADEYGLIRANLSHQGNIIGPNDLLIASIAKAHDAILVTNNTDEFSRVAGLRLVDWQA